MEEDSLHRHMICPKRTLRLTRVHVSPQHSLFRSLAVGFFQNEKMYKELRREAEKYVMGLEKVEDGSRTECLNTIAEKYGFVGVEWSDRGDVVRVIGVQNDNLPIVSFCKSGSGFASVQITGHVLLGSIKCMCTEELHWKSGEYTDLITETESNGVEVSADMWDYILQEKITFWKPYINMSTIEQELREEYGDLCEEKPHYRGVSRHEEGTYSFLFMNTSCGGLHSAWSAAVCREYANIRVGQSKIRRPNFSSNIFISNPPENTFHSSKTLEKYVNWDDITYNYVAKHFISAAKESPCLPCSTCSSLHFRSNMQSNKKRTAENVDSDTESFTCTRCLREKRKTKKYSEANGMRLPQVPDCYKILSTLEERLISPFLAFMKVKLLGVGQQKALVGGVVTVPLDTVQVCESLPQSLQTCEAVIVCLKRKLQMKHSHIQGPVRVALLKHCLQKLIRESPLYKELGATTSDDAFINLAKAIKKAELEGISDNAILREDVEENLLGDNHITFLNVIPSYSLPQSDAIVLAPCAQKKPVSILSYEYMEEVLFPSLFGGQKRSALIDDTGISVRDRIQWEVLQKDRRFAQHSDNLFFKFAVLLHAQVQSIIWTRGRQGTLVDVTAGHLRDGEALKTLFSEALLYNEFKSL